MSEKVNKNLSLQGFHLKQFWTIENVFAALYHVFDHAGSQQLNMDTRTWDAYFLGLVIITI